jgi:catechol 2,3-dioxygenase-like lactoylglutathione lyase family enzyme
MAKLIYSGGVNYIGVRDLAAMVQWYKDKLGLREIDIEMDDCDDCLALGFSKDEYAVTLGPPGKPKEELTQLLFTSNAKKAKELLNSRGVSVTEIQQDAQGTLHFEFHDLEGNVIDVSEEP